MSHQPPTGPTGAPGASDDDAHRTPATPDEAGAEPTESFARSPYDDVAGEGPAADTAAYPGAGYGQAPDPSRPIYSQTGTTEDDEPAPAPGDGRPGWVVPVVVAVILLLVAGGIVAAVLLGGDDEEDPVVPPATATTEVTAEETTAAGETTAPAEAPTDVATTPAPTTEPTQDGTEEPTVDLAEDLDDTVSVDDLTFELSDDGFRSQGVEGAVQAIRGHYLSGDERIDMLATYWADNEAADEYAAELVADVDGEQVETGSTYTNDTGTFWAFLLEDGRGRYIWTTDRGHVMQVTGSTDYVGGFYASFPL